MIDMSYNCQVAEKQLKDKWFTDAEAVMDQKMKRREFNEGGKSAILFIGDGMSLVTVTAARILQGQLNGKTGEENQLTWDKFPFTGLSKTYNVDQQV